VRCGVGRVALLLRYPDEAVARTAPISCARAEHRAQFYEVVAQAEWPRAPHQLVASESEGRAGADHCRCIGTCRPPPRARSGSTRSLSRWDTVSSVPSASSGSLLDHRLTETSDSLRLVTRTRGLYGHPPSGLRVTGRLSSRRARRRPRRPRLPVRPAAASSARRPMGRRCRPLASCSGRRALAGRRCSWRRRDWTTAR
jgi:hypothetical protein